MALPKGMRGRIGTSNGAASGSGPRNRNVRDARDVIRGREQRPPNASTLGPRIFKTPRGLVTNKNTKGISTAQLKNRQQTQHKPTLSAHTHSAAGRPTSKMAVGAAIRKSAVINSNPMLQNAILDIAGALVQQRRQAAQPGKRLQSTKPARLTRTVDRNAIDAMMMDVDEHPSPRRLPPARSRADPHVRGAPSGGGGDVVSGGGADYRAERNAALVSTLSRSLADIPRAAARPFAPERASLSDRMRGRLDQRPDPPCSVIVSNLHPNVSENDINELFRTIGPIVTSMFLSPGTAIVSYHRKNDAVKAVETYHLRLLDGQPMTCVLLSPDMVPDKHQPAIPGSSPSSAPNSVTGRR